MPSLSVGDSQTVTYEDHGAGPVVVLLHGSMSDARMWQKVGAQLSDSFRVVAPNLPGYGGTSPRPAGAAPDTDYPAALIEALIERLGPPLLLAGHSYGGNVALTVALRQRISAGALALLEPVAVPLLAAAGEEAAYAESRSFFDDYVARQRAGDERAVARVLDFWFGPGTFASMPQARQAFFAEQAALNVLDVQATFGEQYSLDALRKLRMRVLAICGEKSPAVTHRVGAVIAAHVGRGSMAVVAGANHALASTHADAVARLLRAHAVGI